MTEYDAARFSSLIKKNILLSLCGFHARAELVKELLHLISDKVLEFPGELLDLLLETGGALLDLATSSLEAFLKLNFNIFEGKVRDGDGDSVMFLIHLLANGIASLANDVSVVGGPTAVPGKDLAEY